jgi:hypothetical protein
LAVAVHSEVGFEPASVVVAVVVAVADLAVVVVEELAEEQERLGSDGSL